MCSSTLQNDSILTPSKWSEAIRFQKNFGRAIYVMGEGSHKSTCVL